MKDVKDFKLDLLTALVSLTLGIVIGNMVRLGSIQKDVEELQEQETIVVIDTLTLNKENFMLVCQYYGVRFPEVVFAQAQLESGHFRSSLYRVNNNMLGLYDSSGKRFYSFEHWTDCVRGYRDLVQYKYNGDDTIDAYYEWLVALPYAEDAEYTKKVKQLVASNKVW